MGTLAEVIAALDSAAENATDEGRKVVSKGCLNIKEAARATMQGYAHLPHYPGSITYDTAVSGDEATGTIGPERKRRQGTLGDLLENGSIHNAPIPHLGPALDAEESRFLSACEDLAERLLDGDR